MNETPGFMGPFWSCNGLISTHSTKYTLLLGKVTAEFDETEIIQQESRHCEHLSYLHKERFQVQNATLCSRVELLWSSKDIVDVML